MSTAHILFELGSRDDSRDALRKPVGHDRLVSMYPIDSLSTTIIIQSTVDLLAPFKPRFAAILAMITCEGVSGDDREFPNRRIENVVRSLSCKINTEILGHSFQGLSAVKQISSKDFELLRMLSAELSLELRARILSEDELEAMLLLGDIEAVKNLVRDERPGIAEARRNYFYKHAPIRNQNLVEKLQEIYSGRCQICEWNPITDYGKELCHGHHIQWLSRGGADEIQNMVLVCPNHHAAIHKLDAPLDYSDFSSDFGAHRESLSLRNHLEAV